MNRKLTYIPTFRLRGEELQAIYACSNLFGDKMLPLFEVITQNPPRSNGTFQQTNSRVLSKFNFKFLLDLPSHIAIKGSIKQPARDFLLQIKSSRTVLIDYFSQLAGIPNLIPVLSHDPQIPYSPGTFVKESTILRQHFSEIAFRVQHNQKNQAAMFKDLMQIVRQDEVVILDGDNSLPSNTALIDSKNNVDVLSNSTNCITIYLRSAIPDGITNVGLIHGMPVAAIDNSHVRTYKNPSGYTGFGDYVGVRKELPKKGGQISPGLIYYFAQNNEFIGYKGNAQDLDEFSRTIIPDLVASTRWRGLTSNHLALCPGCLYAQKVQMGLEDGRSQGMWKRVSMMNYLYTMHEIL